MDTELVKGTLSLLILSLLSRKPMYGYELAATVHRDTDGAFSWREGSLYPSLHKLEAGGLITGRWEEKETGRKRRYYHLTRKEGEALERALADFGGPEEVRAGLEEAHGHRLLPVVIDKAMQWKERAMRAKWLWASWAHLALAGVIALEVMWLTFAEIFLVPKFQRLLRDGLI